MIDIWETNCWTNKVAWAVKKCKPKWERMKIKNKTWRMPCRRTT